MSTASTVTPSIDSTASKSSKREITRIEPTHPATRAAADAERARTVTEPEPLPKIDVPADQAGIDVLRMEIDAIDTELVRLIQRRTAISNAIGEARKSFGGPRIVYSREIAVLDRFRALGPAGTDLGMMLLAMGRGKLGRK